MDELISITQSAAICGVHSITIQRAIKKLKNWLPASYQEKRPRKVDRKTAETIEKNAQEK